MANDDRIMRAFHAGASASRNDLGVEANPHRFTHEDLWTAWMAGWEEEEGPRYVAKKEARPAPALPGMDAAGG